MEASFVVQPWIATRTINDYCKLCFQAKENGDFMPCKRAMSMPYHSLLASLRMDANPAFGDLVKRLEDAKETCLSTKTPGEHCHEKMQSTLQGAVQIFDRMLEDYKNRYAAIQNRITPIAHM